MAKNQGVEVKDVAKSGKKNICHLLAIPACEDYYGAFAITPLVISSTYFYLC